ncbi:MAG TPA: DEAD/DEAH box helicase, partial [Lactococcus sp.]|nr:DEAD/DEAH box helicase [Lactococcus sp.]
MELRPYQIEANEKIQEQWASGVKNTLLVLPTGVGKTVTFSDLTRTLVSQGERVLIMAHRGELLNQAADKLYKVTGLRSAVEKADETAKNSFFRVTVGSVQTLMREKRLKQFPPDYYDTIIVDEAHHVMANGYQNVLNYFSGAKVLGVTATADRTDKKNLGQFFESLAYEYSLPEAIKNKYLSPMKALTIPLKIDLSGVSMSAGDFKASDVGSALDPYLYQIADEMVKYCSDRKTVVFLPLVATSKKFRDILNEKGFKAAEVNGESKDRAEILEDFDNDKYNVLCNSMLLTEGWDSPEVDCV